MDTNERDRGGDEKWRGWVLIPLPSPFPPPHPLCVHTKTFGTKPNYIHVHKSVLSQNWKRPTASRDKTHQQNRNSHKRVDINTKYMNKVIK